MARGSLRVLLLGGTTEASRLAKALAQAGVDAVFSYAGRTDSPIAQPLPTRVGGFGGVAGLQAFLQAERISQAGSRRMMSGQIRRRIHRRAGCQDALARVSGHLETDF